MSYAQLQALVCRWSQGMAEAGVTRGDRVAVILPNDIEFVALTLVAADLGAMLIPLSITLPAGEIRKAFAATGVQHVVSSAALLEPLLESAPGLPELAAGLWLSVDEEIGDTRVRVLRELLRAVPADPAPRAQGRDEDALILSMTSGSTGNPKPIVLTQLTKFNRAMAAVELYGVTADDRTLAATPLYHSLAERLVLIPLLTGGTSIILPRFTVPLWLQCVRQQRVSFSIAVSSQLKQIIAVLEDPGHAGDLASLRCLVSSSALLDLETKAQLLAKLACDFHECYGASEIAIASNLDTAAARTRPRSVGRAAPGVDIRILGVDGGILPRGEAGEIVCRTPMLFGGYFRRPDLTRAAMWGEYFRTGDVGRMDEDGFLYFLGRSKDIIICGGINIYPADVEEAVNAHPAVRESAAFAIPDERLGEVVAVAVVMQAAQRFDLRSLRLHCGERLADFQQPRQFHELAELPRNPMGKIMKFQLVEMFSPADHRKDIARHA